jgi:hypothetical protein
MNSTEDRRGSLALVLLFVAGMSALGKVIDLKAFRERPENPPDVVVNALWDRLLTLVEGAWSWRDAESVEALEQCLAALKGMVAAEWGSSEKAAVFESVRSAIS